MLIKKKIHPVKYRLSRLNNFSERKIRPTAYSTGRAVISLVTKLFNRVKKFIPKFLLNSYHHKLALLAAIFYNFPGKKIHPVKSAKGGAKQFNRIKVIGVTGTKGKSTSVILIGKILEEAGFKVAWLTSATIKIIDKEVLNPYHMTMPGRFVIQKFLRDALKSKCDYAILEVTSEGVKQHRHKFINFDTAVFTNLKPEHIEAHGSFENYRFCKGKLFKETKNIHILNLDDENIDYFMRFCADKKIKYSASNPKADVFAKNIQESKDGVKFSVDGTDFNLKLLGKFNVLNSLSAIGVGLSHNISLGTCKKALEKINIIPGRMEAIIEMPYKVIIDLAHTPDSYEEVFKAVKAFPHNKIIAVFGSAGGGRDKWKRPVLGKIAGKSADFIVLCNEDPYDENPEGILSEIKKGIIDVGFIKENLFEVLDRREAIRKGLELAKENDIVLILGKGTEQLMFLPTGKIPWDDRSVTKEEFKALTLV